MSGVDYGVSERVSFGVAWNNRHTAGARRHLVQWKSPIWVLACTGSRGTEPSYRVTTQQISCPACVKLLLP